MSYPGEPTPWRAAVVYGAPLLGHLLLIPVSILLDWSWIIVGLNVLDLAVSAYPWTDANGSMTAMRFVPGRSTRTIR